VADRSEDDVEEHVDPGAPFLAASPCEGHGRLWLYASDVDVLVAVDPGTLVARVHAELGPPPDGADPEAGAQLLVTAERVWVARDALLVAVDPWSAATTSVAVPSGNRAWTTDGDRLWATAWPAPDVLEVHLGSGTQRRVDVGGHLTEACASAGTLWVVDRTDETVLGLDTATLQPRVRLPFDGGRVHLLPWAGGVLATRTEEQGVIATGVGNLDTTTLWLVDGSGSRRQVLYSGAGGAAVPLGDAVWVTALREPALEDRRQAPGRVGVASPRSYLSSLQDLPDPVTLLQEVLLPAGAPGRHHVVEGQVLQLAAGEGRLWAQGFVRSRQESPISLVDPERGVVGEVDLAVLDLSGYPSTRRPARAEVEPETPDQTLERLPGAVQRALTATTWRVDARTGDRSERPWLDSRFALVDVRVEPETYDVLVTFTWAEEPGTTFGYVFAADPAWSSEEVAGILDVELKEDLDTGIMRWGERSEGDRVVWVSRPQGREQPADDPGSFGD